MRVHITFEVVKIRGEKNLPCPKCGRKVKRSATFEQTMNPWNVKADGTPKTRLDIFAELKAEREAWEAQPVLCSRCKEASQHA